MLEQPVHRLFNVACTILQSVKPTAAVERTSHEARARNMPCGNCLDVAVLSLDISNHTSSRASTSRLLSALESIPRLSADDKPAMLRRIYRTGHIHVQAARWGVPNEQKTSIIGGRMG
jgi:hypothetical protein